MAALLGVAAWPGWSTVAQWRGVRPLAADLARLATCR
jgi:hypothetical protein